MSRTGAMGTKPCYQPAASILNGVARHKAGLAEEVERAEGGTQSPLPPARREPSRFCCNRHRTRARFPPRGFNSPRSVLPLILAF